MADTRQDTRDLLLEVGVEELPARFCPGALEQLRQKAERALDEARLAHGPVEVFGTPRRLVLLVQDVATQQADREVVARGPARKAAYDAEGRPTRALEGFARGQGIAVDDVEVRADDKGVEYVYARKLEQGQPVTTILPPLLEQLILSLEFPKSMRWGAGQTRFARPIRWILALFGDARVPLQIEGIASQRTTRGHRTLTGNEEAAVDNPRDYFAKCAHLYVMVDHSQRQNIIWHQVQQEARHLGGYVPRDEDLLEEVTWLVEQPYAFSGSFDPDYLEIPAEVLVTSMRNHQRYFPVYDQAGGRLLPHFIAVRNGLDEHLDNVRKGNERVLRARLADARFFFSEDRKTTLADKVEKLRDIVFQEKLGSLYQKVGRVRELAGWLAGALQLDAADADRCGRTAWLCKADLATAMVYEFTELEGVMGREYAVRDGEDPEVAAGIHEHYLPRFAGDSLPARATGIVAGLADRLDTLAGFFSIGLIPTGSADPYALRRTAQGAVLIITEAELRLPLAALVDQALAGYTQLDAATRAATRSELLGFFRARLEGLLKERGSRYDVVDAVLAAGFDDPVDLLLRAEALARLMEQPEFTDVFIAFKRVANLGARAGEAFVDLPETRQGLADGTFRWADVVQPELFAEPAERALWQAVARLREPLQAALAAGDYAGFYEQVARLKAPVDGFLDGVLVMDENPGVRRNRLALLRAVAEVIGGPADLGRLAVG